MRTPKLSGRWRLVIAFVVFALVAVACGDDDATVTTTTPTTAATTTTAGQTTTTTEAPPAAFTYRTGIFQDTSTDNYWSYLDPQSTVWNAYVLGATKPALFAINLPGLELDSDLAANADPGVAVEDGDGWSVTVPMREDAVWSDGTPITANDVAFTANAVNDLGLGGNWIGSYQWVTIDEATGAPAVDPVSGNPILGLTAVEAIDDYTVKFTWNAQPGLAIWPHGPGLGPIMAEHFWGETVEAAKATEAPADTLYAASGAGDPSGGPMVFDTREEGAFARTVANTTENGFTGYYDKGREITSGGVTYTVGPFITDQTYSLYGDQSAAVLALKAGEVDYLYNPLGLQRGLLDQITSDENLTAVVNRTNGFRYLAFNLRDEPMSVPGFRDAVAFMIDKEYVASRVLQNVAFPLYASVPEGNVNWYNEEKAAGYQAVYTGLTMDMRWDGTAFSDGRTGVTGTEARLHAAAKALVDAGFAWPEGQGPDFAANAIVPACQTTPRCITLNGAPVDRIEILAPGPGYDPLRATYSLIIAQALKDLGFDAEARPTDFGIIVNKVFTPTAEGTLDFQMYILGYSLGNPALPTYHEAFWAGKNDTLGPNNGDNATGYNSPEFNALVEQFNQALTTEDAYDIMWQMEDVFFQDKPFILLFDTGIIEAYRSASVNFPFTDTLSGLQFGNGFSGLVTASQ